MKGYGSKRCTGRSRWEGEREERWGREKGVKDRAVIAKKCEKKKESERKGPEREKRTMRGREIHVALKLKPSRLWLADI